MQFAQYDAGFQHKHYLGAASKYEIIEELETGQKGFFIKVFFVNDQVNMNDWQITWEGIKRDIGDVVGVPIVAQPDMQHPNFQVQNLFAKGYIVDYVLDEAKHEVQVIARILDANTIKLIREGKYQFVSPAVVARDSLSIKEVDGVDLLERWIALHLALVADPAYGKERAKISGTCTGKGDRCSIQLKNLTKPTVEELVAGKQEDCVSRKIPIIMEENPKMKHDQAIAIAESMCAKNPKVADGNPDPENHFISKTASYDGQNGYWISKNQQWVFVASNKTVDQSIKEQCGCSKKKLEFKIASKELASAITDVREDEFIGPSSFVGMVTWFEDETMTIILNNRTYNYCRISRRIFDSFEGADSKGAFYNRIIKGQYDC